MGFFSSVARFFGGGKKSRRRRNLERVRAVREAVPERPRARRELIIALLCGANLLITPWAVGGRLLWAQWLGLALSLAAFAFLFLPVGYDNWRSVPARQSLRELIKFPPFWCGLGVMLIFLIQGLNPAYTVEFDLGGWWVIPILHQAGLPAGVAAPFDGEPPVGGMNAFRTALIFASPWLTFCALWCGLRSRRIVSALAATLLVSAVALAIFGIAMRSSGETHLYGVIPVAGYSAFGPFLYQNQAGAFFCLAASLGLSFALAEWLRATDAGRTGGRHLPALMGCFLLAGAALVSASFAAVLVLALALPVGLGACVVVARRVRGEFGRLAAPLLATVSVLLLALVSVIAASGDFESTVNKVKAKITLAQTASLDDREAIRRATWLMRRDGDGFWGYGAGSYRWVSPTYYARVPEFCDSTGRLHTRSDHAHCDWLQMLTEWGPVALAAVLGAALWVAYRLRRGLSAAMAQSWPALAGLLLLVLHSGMDCLFFNPSVALLAGFAAFYARHLIRIQSDDSRS